MAYFIGLDLGQSADYAALAIVHAVDEYNADKRQLEKYLHLRHLERFPLKTPYTEVADHVRDLLSGPPFTEEEYDPSKHRIAKPTVELLVDKTGVGVAVTDLLKERRLRFTSITITGMGQKITYAGKGAYNVPKMDLVAVLEVPFHKGMLKVAEGLRLWPHAARRATQLPAQAEHEDISRLLRALARDRSGRPGASGRPDVLGRNPSADRAPARNQRASGRTPYGSLA